MRGDTLDAGLPEAAPRSGPPKPLIALDRSGAGNAALRVCCDRGRSANPTLRGR